MESIRDRMRSQKAVADSWIFSFHPLLLKSHRLSFHLLWHLPHLPLSFLQITLSLILPLSFIFLSHIKISSLIFCDIDHDVDALESTPDYSPSQNRLLHRIASECLSFLLFKAVYLLVLLFALLSTSAVVYTIASIYTGKDLTFSKILTVVPKVGRRLKIT